MNSTVSPDCQGLQSILAELNGVIANSQSALLASKLQQLESCVRQQRSLCERLESALRKYSRSHPYACDPECMRIAVSALEAREQNRVLSAVLRRMRRNLEVMRNALAGASVEYLGAQPASPTGRI